MTTPRRFAYVAGLASYTKKKVTVFDLETAGFMKTKNQGITEIGCFTVVAGGTGYKYGTLFDPGCPISSTAAEITGITAEMVAGKEHFTDKYSKAFDDIANNHVVVVWNGRSFDCRYIIAVEVAKGMPARAFNQVLDVMQVYAKLENSGKPATLVEAFNQLGLAVDESYRAHRAAADVAMTTEILDVLLEKHQLAVLDFISPLNKTLVKTDEPVFLVESPESISDSPPPELKTKVSKAEVFKFIEEHRYMGIAQMAKALGYDQNKLEFALSRYLDAGEINPLDLSEDEVIDWLVPTLQEFPTELVSGQLKPLKQKLDELHPDKPVSYLQLRVGLYFGGFR